MSSLTHKDYQRVPGQIRVRRSLGGSSRLVSAADHLMLVTCEMATEHYRRFYYRDIEAFIIRPTRERALYNIVLSLLISLLGLWTGMAVTGYEPEIAAIPIFIAIPIVIIMLVVTLGGTRCKVLIQTRVQTVEIPSLGRLRKLPKALEYIEERINLAQPQIDRPVNPQVAAIAEQPEPRAAAATPEMPETQTATTY